MKLQNGWILQINGRKYVYREKDKGYYSIKYLIEFGKNNAFLKGSIRYRWLIRDWENQGRIIINKT